MSEPKNHAKQVDDAELQDMVAATDSGARNPSGWQKVLLLGTALCWSLFQIWIASPLPFYDWPVVGSFGVFNDTEARSIHLAFAVFLAFLAYPALGGSPRDRVPVLDLVLALVGAFTAAYLFIFYEQLSTRPGAPITQDIVVACVGMVLLLEATRRALGPPLVIVAVVFLVYTFAGPYMPDIIAHKGAGLAQVVNHQWVTTEGVFGIALGVSTSFVFLFVLFGALLDKAGAGNYFIKLAFSLLGHLRGGPAKAAVVSSGMTGLISGSSIANVVTTGTFTVPMMKKVGFSAEKAGAVEVASSVNGQIMPPVMGAAAFLMVEYVGLSYVEVITHAFLPALISYIALVYIVHLEALKLGMQGLPRRGVAKTWQARLMGFLLGFLITTGIALAVYYGLGWLKPLLGGAAGPVISLLLGAVYVGMIAFAARYPELQLDDPNADVIELPETGPTFKSGLHYLLPVVVLVWCLMVERLSPGLSAFWASVLMIVILLTQRPLFAVFRRSGNLQEAWKLGLAQLIDGLISGARNMIGIGIATATAGIIVGAVSQTGVGSVLADLVEVLSFGNLLLMLLLTAVLSLILGMGLPTTANYIVVSSLLAPVIVTLGQESGLIVPLIAVHLFVFYFGIMADVTPPVGLASFAAAAVSGGDPIRTGFVAFFYSLRTAILPFLFIFNTDLLLINVDWWHGIAVFVISTIGILLFTAATQGYFFARNRLYETLLLLLIAFSLFRPGFWMDMIVPPYESRPGQVLLDGSGDIDAGSRLRLHIEGVDDIGNPRSFVAVLTLGEGDNTVDRLADAGLELLDSDGKVLVDMVGFGSRAEDAGLMFDQVIERVEVPQWQPPKELIFIPALLLLVPVVALQRRRRRSEEPAVRAEASGG
ncbi:C4-dicarboxylate ABC transporter [Marinobacterium nitratireducens]|uniref:C4-dicarboxylate ABC transporter n=1 Tax=Marinobacterium nitratireducens TaxID=518897 RepID=A0A918DXY1_9GAMM|nr:TRAP transporter permease [Marinobacterium nitratireducens]GGO87621.1 C4-dicarboxylate ABC transporter [Marinobacterium nitratireducens]